MAKVSEISKAKYSLLYVANETNVCLDSIYVRKNIKSYKNLQFTNDYPNANLVLKVRSLYIFPIGILSCWSKNSYTRRER